MKMDIIKESIQPKRDQLMKENEEILSQIEVMVNILEKRKNKYEENTAKINEMDQILSGYL